MSPLRRSPKHSEHDSSAGGILPSARGLDAALSAIGVSKFYGDVIAVDKLSLQVRRGEARGLVGPNGAGKTTLMAMVLGLSRPDRGSLTVLGQSSSTGRGGTPAGVSGFVDTPTFYPHLSARQNLRLLADLGGRIASRDIEPALERVGLGEVGGDRVGGYSLGMRQRLGLASALVGRPRLVVLDEPTNGLDPGGKRDVREVIRDLAAADVAVLLSSHQMDDIEALCSTVTVMSGGRVAFDGDLRSLRASAPAPVYRLRTSHRDAALRVASHAAGVEIVAGTPSVDRGLLTVRAQQAAVDRYLADLITDGVAIREFGPLLSPLEALFIQLTDPAAADVGPAGDLGPVGQAAPEPTGAPV